MKSNMEPLSVLPSHQWPALRELYLRDWPANVVGHSILATLISYPALMSDFNLTIYCPQGDINNGMIVVGRENMDKGIVLMIHPIGDDVQAIETALLNTTIIDFSKLNLAASAKQSVVDCLERIKDRRKINLYYGPQTKAVLHLLNTGSKRFENLCCPPNTYLGPLKPEHIELVDKTWAYHGKESHKLFEVYMKNNRTYVLYNTDHKPIAWLFVNEAGALTHLYCLEEYRRKGYAEYLTKFVTNEMLEKGFNVIAFTVPENSNPQNLFTKLGYEIIRSDYWVIFP